MTEFFYLIVIKYQQLNAYNFFLIQDFRTPKPPVFCSLREKLRNTEVQKIAHSLDDNENRSETSTISFSFQSQLLATNSSYKCKIRFFLSSDFCTINILNSLGSVIEDGSYCL